MNKNGKNNLTIILILIGVAILIYFLYMKTDNVSKPFMEVILYDQNGNPLNRGQSYSIVNGQPNVGFVAFVINVCNQDTITLQFDVTNFSSSHFNSITSQFRPTNTISIGANQCSGFLTNQINVTPYEGYSVQFCSVITSRQIANTRNSLSKSGCLNLTITTQTTTIPSNPIFNISVSGVLNDSLVNPPCVENWQCTSWSSCIGGTQTRTCTDSNNCQTFNNRPPLSQTCSDFIRGSSCGTGFDGYYNIAECNIQVDVNSDGNLETKGPFWNKITSINCNNYGTVELSAKTTEGYALRYNPTSQQLFICNADKTQVIY